MKLKFWMYLIIAAALVLSIGGCSSGSSDELENLAEITLDPPQRKPIDTSRTGVNAFVNDAAFGSIDAQFSEVKSTLNIDFVRVLFAWSDEVQPSPESTPNFSFYDDIASSIPSGVDALAVLTGLPAWMSASANWLNGDARATFVELWVKPVMTRYAGRNRIKGWQIWNEPNQPNSNNELLQVANSPENYLEMLARAYDFSKSLNGKLVLNAATTAIAQNFPDTLNYNRDLISMGVLDVCDIYAIHVYGKQYENYVRDGGVIDTLSAVTKPMWITESGAQGAGAQRAYVEEVWPFLQERIPQIDRIYYYQFTENTPAATTYGLKSYSGVISDLYTFLRDR